MDHNETPLDALKHVLTWTGCSEDIPAHRSRAYRGVSDAVIAFRRGSCQSPGPGTRWNGAFVPVRNYTYVPAVTSRNICCLSRLMGTEIIFLYFCTGSLHMVDLISTELRMASVGVQKQVDKAEMSINVSSSSSII